MPRNGQARRPVLQHRADPPRDEFVVPQAFREGLLAGPCVAGVKDVEVRDVNGNTGAGTLATTPATCWWSLFRRKRARTAWNYLGPRIPVSDFRPSSRSIGIATKTCMDSGSEPAISAAHRIGCCANHTTAPSAKTVATSTSEARINHDL